MLKDFAEWKKVFDDSTSPRSSDGEQSHQIYLDPSDPNKMAIVYQWNSASNAQRFFQSPELKAVQVKAGGEDPPNIYFPKDA